MRVAANEKAQRTSMRKWASWIAVALLTLALMAITSAQAFARYHSLASGWSWDLAYYNQWYWALTQGDGQISVRPISSYADEGPSVWKMNYLSPLRFAIVPLYMLWPDPRLLLLVQNVLFWLVVPFSFALVRAESRSTAFALAATALVPATPLLWPLVWNDFRELQIGLPFLVLAVHGFRGRSKKLTALAIVALLACRQEFAVVVASLAIVPPREKEDVGRSYAWAQAVFLVGLCWFLFAFFGYLKWVVASNAPQLYLDQFGGEKAGLGETLYTASAFWFVGLGAWAVWAFFAPRVALVALPWLWTLSGGKWALWLIGTEQWHHVRYTAPFVGLGLAAGLVGLGGLARRVLAWSRGAWLAAEMLALTAVGLAIADARLASLWGQYSPPISAAEAEEFWRILEQVRPDDAVLATYEVAAPLSCRRELYSYILDSNKPHGYPKLAPNLRWVFRRRSDVDAQVREILFDQSFEIVYKGEFLVVFRRVPGQGGGKVEKKEDRARTS